MCPVEYKTGAPREDDDGRTLWDADRMQLGLQILLLRENGYRCDEGVVFYRESRQRIRFILTPEDEAWIRRGVAAARICTTGPIPAPLDHSPKCPRCSLAPICLPDETQFLQLSTPDAELPESLTQLALPGLVGEATSLDEAQTSALADQLTSEEAAPERLPEPRPAPQPRARSVGS